MPQPEHSPTTARLENPPVNKSVFAFLKGTTQSHNHHGHRDPFYATDLPALTRIKARSSIEQKTNRLLLPHGTRCPTPNVGSKARSHLSVSINLRDPHLDSSSSASSMSATTAMETATGSSRGPLSSSPLSCSSDASLPPHPPALLARNSVLHGKAASRSSCTQSPSIAPILSRLDINAPCSSSVMGLYPGSARSSPNGSLADAASVRAVYCHSLKSTMSYTTQAESTLGLVENHEIEPR
ncbi:hypothetical protein B0O80DRAFT_439670 [Mortierella sp. GBAus27b]|nr:hypothetical protein B0O80DRAFT_439670 [Mortierella sp. GBAus27b]